GMEKGIHYITQATNVDGEDVRSEGGTAQRPDVVLLMPDKKNLVIDSKVSLTDYANMIAATTEEERKKAEKDHFNSVKRHIDELSEKKYQEKVKNSADFVMMFIPNEAAYMQAMHHDSNLWDYAYKRQVVIISPTHLISVVRLMHQLWSREMQAKNALAIAEEAGKMYDKFAGFVDDFQKIGSTIESVGKVYDQAWNKLSSGKGNLLSKAEKLKSMGIKATKQLPESNEE
ncbi:MAG: DNA recombination protein RmuC, partial [Muribaculaceae bacterium]|nr:DNA recombination protein RmuC [Muribaculaceae bacterium]